MLGVAAQNKLDMFQLEIVKPPSNYIVINTPIEIRVCLKKGSRPYDSAPLYGLTMECTYENSGDAYSAVDYDGTPGFDVFGVGMIKFQFTDIAQVIDGKIQKIVLVLSALDEAGHVIASTATFPIVCVEYYLDVQVSLPAPFIFYKDKGGKDAGMNMTVYLRRGDDVVLNTSIKIRPALQYENGKMVEDQGILKSINDLENFNINATGSTKLKFRINEVSSKHMNQKFCIVMMKNVPGDAISDVAPGRSLAIDVRSKTNRKREDEEDEDGIGTGSAQANKRRKDGSASLPLTTDSLALISGKMGKDMEDSIARLQLFHSEMSKMLDVIRWRQNFPHSYPNEIIDNFLREWNGRYEDSMKTLFWVHNALTKNEHTRLSVGKLFHSAAPYTQESYYSDHNNIHRVLQSTGPMPFSSQETTVPMITTWDSKFGKTLPESYNWNGGNPSSSQPQPQSSSGMAMLAEAAKVAEHNEIPRGSSSRTQLVTTVKETALAASLQNILGTTPRKWNDEDVRFIFKAHVTVDNLDYGFPAFAGTDTNYRLCGFYQIKIDPEPGDFDRNQVLFSAMSKKKITVKYSTGLESSEFHAETDVFAVEHSFEEGNFNYIYMQPDRSVLSSFLRRFVFAKLDQLPTLLVIQKKLESVLSPSQQRLNDLITTNGDGAMRREVSEALQSGSDKSFAFTATGELLYE